MRSFAKGTTAAGQMAEIRGSAVSALAAIRAIGDPAESFSQLSQLAETLAEVSDWVTHWRDWQAASMYDSGQVQSYNQLAEVMGGSKTRAVQRVEAGREKGNPVKDPGTTPEPNVVAVAVIIEPSIGKVLTEHRTDLAPEWTFAGGEIEKGESPVEAIQRRVPVETGLAVVTDYLIGSELSARTGRFLRYMLCHLAEPDRYGEATADLDPDADRIRWMTPAELDVAMPDMHKGVRSLIRRKLGS
jgi:8-oxo-dGTP pyrophosphatase MutT (NUDIX family)